MADGVAEVVVNILYASRSFGVWFMLLIITKINKDGGGGGGWGGERKEPEPITR